MIEHTALGIDKLGHERASWMRVHFAFFLLSALVGVHATIALKRGKLMSATRLGIVPSTAKILLLSFLFVYLSSEFIV